MPEHREGERVPEVTFRVHEDGSWKDVTTAELFSGKAVVVFSLPGAFTPTCSGAHVPRFNQLAPVFARHGVDDIICMSVNDSFVMNAWKQSQDAHRITFIGDGNGEFTREMGMMVDKADLGFGPRSWRYSMLVRDGVIEKMFVEPDQEGDPYEVSDADTMLKYLDPEHGAPADVMMFSKPGCGFCAKARKLLESKGLEYAEIDATPQMLRAVSGRHTTPQVFIDGRHIGGSDDLERHFASTP